MKVTVSVTFSELNDNLHEFKDVKDVSFYILAKIPEQTIKIISPSIFEQAFDYRIGILITKFMKYIISKQKKIHSFLVVIDTKEDIVSLTTNSGDVLVSM